MASSHSGFSQTSPALPPYLMSSWRLDPRERAGHQLDGLTTSRISKELIEIQLSMHEKAQRKRDHKTVPSLSSLAVGSAQEMLLASKNPAQEAQTIVESLDPEDLKRLLNHPALSYPVFRRLHSAARQWSSLNVEKEIDIDLVVLRNERHIRSRPKHANQDGRYLLHLRDLPDILPDSVLSDSGSVLGFVRAEPPKGGLEMFKHTPETTELQTFHATDFSFTETFRRITNGILDGLDWTNVVLIGGMVLTTLMHTNLSSDNDPEIVEPDLDLYLYGIGPDEANAKVEQIYEAWSRNLPPDVWDRKVVRNAKTINFLADYPNRRVQVVLKLLPSPTDMLLNCDLDACALAFNGSQVLMLPRFVRALETGSSMFTMDLVWGHHLGHRRATQESRVFKYAKRGFGLRILPSYAKSLEKDFSSKVKAEPNNVGLEVRVTRDESIAKEHEQRDRFPHGQEHGLKTLKRIAYLGSDYTHRFIFGISPLVLSPQELKAKRGGVSPEFDQEEPEQADWVEKMKKARGDVAKKHRFISLADLDRYDYEFHPPYFRGGFGNLEKFMRHSEAWRLDAVTSIMDGMLNATHKVHLQQHNWSNPAYDVDGYDEMPQYKWREEFSAGEFTALLDSANLIYWADVKATVCQRVGIPITLSGFADYSTRKLRRQVHGDDLKSALARQLTIPVIIPPKLEHYITHVLPARFPDLPEFFTSKPYLTLFHRSADLPATNLIPSLDQNVKTEAGNLRWWVISNQTMWAHQHRVIDEIHEVLWSLYRWLRQEAPHHANGRGPNTDRQKCVRHIARIFRRRCVVPEIDDEDDIGKGLPSLRETLLFRQWALPSPFTLDRKARSDLPGYEYWHKLFEGENVRYPFADELFWKGDEEELGISAEDEKFERGGRRWAR